LTLNERNSYMGFLIKRDANIMVTNSFIQPIRYRNVKKIATTWFYCQVITEIRCFPSIFMVSGLSKRT